MTDHQMHLWRLSENNRRAPELMEFWRQNQGPFAVPVNIGHAIPPPPPADLPPAVAGAQVPPEPPRHPPRQQIRGSQPKPLGMPARADVGDEEVAGPDDQAGVTRRDRSRSAHSQGDFVTDSRQKGMGQAGQASLPQRARAATLTAAAIRAAVESVCV